MRFRVLGSVEVDVAGDWQVPGPPKQRAVLAVLLLRANRTVTVDALVQALWADQPPRHAVKNVQTYVWRLRQLIGARLESRPAGYRLTIEAGELDAAMFADLAEQAAHARTRGDLDGARDRLASGLALWQGAALSDLVFAGMLADVAAPLEAERLRAIHDLVDVMLAQGLHDQLIAQLTAFVASYPLDERLRERQVMALHRAGRDHEALRALGAARSMLATELDTGPGAGLRALATMVTRHLAQHTSPTPPAPQIRQLPPTVSTFVGRAREQGWLRYQLAPLASAVPVVLLAGLGGVGKSALAIHVAHQIADMFPDGQLYLDLQGDSPTLEPLPADRAVRRLLDALGVDPADTRGDIDALYRRHTTGRRLLLVLDHVADAAQLRALLPSSGGCAVLATSRRILTGVAGATQLQLPMLSTADGIDLFLRTAGSRVMVDDDPTAVDRVVEACAGLPLALRLVAARLAARPSWPMRSLAERLHDERHRLDVLSAGDIAVRASFAVSYQQLARDQRLVFRRCGLFPGSQFGPEAVAALAQVPVAEAARVLEWLADGSLLDSVQPNRYRLHDLIRIYAVERADADDGPEACRAALARLADYFVHAADAADRLLMPVRARITLPAADADSPTVRFADRSEALAWYEAEHANLTAITELAGDRELHRQAWALPMVMRGFLELRRYGDDWVRTHQVGVSSARALNDSEAESRILNGLGTGWWRQERYAEAIDCYRQALRLAIALGDRRGAAVILNNLGSVYGDLGDHDSAIGYLNEALAIRHEIGDLLDESYALHNLGHVYHECGRHEAALPLLLRALEIRQQLGNRHGESVTLHCIADTLLGLGRHDEAADATARCRDIFTETGNRYGLAAASHTLGRIQIAQRRPEEAAAALHHAVAQYHQLGNQRDEVMALRDLDDIEPIRAATEAGADTPVDAGAH